jgi:hypothetical protein
MRLDAFVIADVELQTLDSRLYSSPELLNVGMHPWYMCIAVGSALW